MKKFIFKLVIIFILPFSILIYFEVRLDKLPNSYNTKRKYLEAQLDSIEVLVSGASRALLGINPAYFEYYGFNLANANQSIFYDSKITLKYFDKMPKLKFVIFDVAYSTIGFQLNDGPEYWRDYFYTRDWGIFNSNDNKLDFKLYSKYFLYTPETSIKFLFKNFKNNLNMCYNGYQRNSNSTFDLSDELCKNHAENDNSIFNDKNLFENNNELRNLIKELKKKNIRFIMITSPTYKNYLKYLDQYKYQKFTKIINSISKDFNVLYKDYSNDLRFSDSCFFNCDHLNENGAKILSKIIDKEILNCKK